MSEMQLRVTLQAILIGAVSLLLGACSPGATAPGEVETVNELVDAFRAKGLRVSLGGETSPRENRYFSVSSRDVMVGEARLKVFEYRAAGQADGDARLISNEGQPNPRTAIGWIAPPHFYKQGRLIVLYVGCADDILRVLDELLGAAVANGPGCN
jgi:hypothetical protein